ncbi:MAG: AmmeMemoRadiSam system protein B [Bacillota bacterium]
MVGQGFIRLPLLVALLVPLLLGPGRPAEAPSARVAPPGPSVAAVQPNAFFDPALFYPGLQVAAGQSAEPTAGRLVGGVVPHHNLAAALLSGFFVQLEERPPATVIVVGPNHENRGQAVITGYRGWQTDFGVVETDRRLVQALVREGLAVVDEEALSAEHTIGALMPYLKYHAPDARLVPLILHRDIALPQLHRLAEALAGELGDDRLLLASVDFSHYLTRSEAEKKDAETLQAIEAFDLPALMRMGPDHVDSPGSLAVLMLAMQKLGARGPHKTGHTNSGVILPSETIETTSYFTFVYLLD